MFDSRTVLSPYGIRSLSKTDLLFHKDEDYWRGNVWINVNYLVYRGLLKHYISDYGDMTIHGISLKEHTDMLRDSLVNNVKNEFD